MSKISDKATGVREKLSSKLPSKMRKDKTPIRITNDTIAEHREKILAGGRKFKYPLQYSKHRILINAIIVVIVAFIAFGIWLWAMLYRNQEMGNFYYSATKILPLPVAEVDGQPVKYSDYLRRIRASVYYYKTQENKSFSTVDGQRELSEIKRRELDVVERAAYAVKIANEQNIKVTDDEVEDLIASQRKSNNSDEASFGRMLAMYNNWTLDDYTAELRSQLLERKVAFAIDKSARDYADDIKRRLDGGEDFAAIIDKEDGGLLARSASGVRVSQVGDADDMGLIAAARQLDEGQVSSVIASPSRCGYNDDGSDGSYCYFIVKLESKGDSETRYSVVQISLTKFDKDFAALRDQGKIKEFIEI